MRWVEKSEWPRPLEIEANTNAGLFCVYEYLGCGDEKRYAAGWVPVGSFYSDVMIGRYHTPGAAKAACKRYAKRMAAAFKAMGKAGWQ